MLAYRRSRLHLPFAEQVTSGSTPPKHQSLSFLSLSSAPPTPLANAPDSFQGDDKTKRCESTNPGTYPLASIDRPAPGLLSSYIQRIEHGFADRSHSPRLPRGEDEVGRTGVKGTNCKFLRSQSRSSPFRLTISPVQSSPIISPPCLMGPI